MLRALLLILLIFSCEAFAQSSFKQLDLVVSIPSEFYINPNTDQELELSKEQAETEVRTAINIANSYYKDLNVNLNIVKIVNYKDSEDPYTQHGNSATGILDEAKNLYDTYDVDYDIGIVVGRGYFNGVYGLAYPSVSCTNKEFSQVFVSTSGIGEQRRYSFAHTIAHEVGHVIGMTHDDDLHDEQLSIMATNYVDKPHGFSLSSIDRAQSRISGSGGDCLSEVVTTDIDNDGYSDELEIEFGSIAVDRGSIPQIPSDSWYSTWNGFLSLTNIIELVNRSTEANTVDIKLRDIQGNIIESRSYNLAPSAQFDVILNEWSNFEKDSYGTVEISSTELIDGRLSLYSIQNGIHNFSTTIPFLKSIKDITNVTFNTYYPNQLSVYDHVINYLTLVNLDDVSKSFRVVTFNEFGEVVKQRLVSIPANSRHDVEAGHESMDLARTGSHKIIPEDLNSPYLSYISRYGFGGPEQNNLSVTFASVQLAEAASGSNKANTFLSKNDGYTYLEIFNSNSANTKFRVKLFAPDSSLISDNQYSLEGYKQVHLSLTSELNALGLETGSFVIEPEDTESLNTQLYVYEFSNEFDGYVPGSVVTANLALQNISNTQNSIYNSFNLFLNAQNYLLLSNYSDTNEVIQVSHDDILINNYRLLPNQTIMLDLREIEFFSDRDSTYGALKLNASGQIGASLIRKGNTSSFSNLMLKTNFR